MSKKTHDEFQRFASRPSVTSKWIHFHRIFKRKFFPKVKKNRKLFERHVVFVFVFLSRRLFIRFDVGLCFSSSSLCDDVVSRKRRRFRFDVRCLPFSVSSSQWSLFIMSIVFLSRLMQLQQLLSQQKNKNRKLIFCFSFLHQTFYLNPNGSVIQFDSMLILLQVLFFLFVYLFFISFC